MRIKQILDKGLARLGYELSRLPSEQPAGALSSSYQCSMLALLAHTRSLRIAQIGANDGSINDPLYDFVHRFPDRTEILLVEPQTTLLPYLKDNYAFHPNYKVFNGAVGPGDQLTLYSVKEAFWKDLKVGYAEGWPEYRAPTGITSTSKEHVLGWLRCNLGRAIDPHTVIEERVVQSIQLRDLLLAMKLPDSIDILQIDAEGFDDVVIYNSNIEELRPTIVYFEAMNLCPDKYEALQTYLIQRGYMVSLQGGDALAIRPSVEGVLSSQEPISSHG